MSENTYEGRKFTDEELFAFPENLENIEDLAPNCVLEHTISRRKEFLKKQYEDNPQFADYCVHYGLHLIENGELIEGCRILNRAYGVDTKWAYAIFHKARVAAVLGEVEYMVEFLWRAFRTAECFKQLTGGATRLKQMARRYKEFRPYLDEPLFRQVCTHNYNTRKDRNGFFDDRF